MDPNEFQIKFTVDNSDARAKFKASDAAVDRLAAKSDSSAKQMAAALGASAKSQVESIGRVDRATRDMAGRFVASGKQMADAHQKAAADSAKAWGKAGALSTSFADSLKGFATANLSFAGLAGAIRAVGSAFGESNKMLDDYGKSLTKARDDLKELATLKGLVSADDKFIRDVANFGRATGLSITESDAFQKQYYGSLAAGQTKGNIQDDTTKDLMIEGARVASRQTKDMATRGDLLGVISQFQKLAPGRKGTEEALATAESVRQALVAGRGDDAPLTRSLLNVAGSFVGDKGPVPSLPEMAAIVSTMSLSAGPAAADSRAEALIRGLRGTTKEQMEWLRAHGINETDTAEVKLGKLVPQLRAEQAGGRDIATYLTESGFNDEMSRAFSEVLPNYETLKERLRLSRNAQSGASLIAESDRLAASDPNQRQRLADAALAAARLERGFEREPIQADVTRGQAALVARGEDTSVPAMVGDWFRYLGSFGTKSGLEVRAEREAIRSGRAATGAGMGAGDYASAALGMLPVVGPLATAAMPTVGEGFASATGAHADELLRLRKAIEEQTAETRAQTRALVNAIADQTKRLEPSKTPVGPLAPARPGPGWVR